MIPFDFDYYRPDTLSEAYDCFMHIKNSEKKPLYYSGGTEIISMAKVSSINFDAVIDLKAIPEYNELYKKDSRLVLGGGLTLTQIVKSKTFEALAQAVNRIADHTMQEKITLAGNLAGGIKYKEAALALMLCECGAKIMTKNGPTTAPFSQIFDGELNLNVGEFLISIDVPESETNLPFYHKKKTKMTKIDYPLTTILAVKNEGKIKAAITGYADKPLVLPEDRLNNKDLNGENKIKRIVEHMSNKAVTELSGTSAYKNFVLGNLLEEAFENLDKL